MKIIRKNGAPINIDRSRRIVINTTRAAWIQSPSKGVWRKPLEREAPESRQVTSIVHYKPNSIFNKHMHPNGEEIFVFDGVFEDELGRYPAGSYFRNPPGSSHAPRSPEGCLLLVKLNMFQVKDAEAVNINTETLSWLPGVIDGLSVKPLHSFKTEHTSLVRWQPGTKFQSHTHLGGEEIFVLEGVFEDNLGSYPKGSWLRNPPYSQHNPFSTNGCTILVKTGHIN